MSYVYGGDNNTYSTHASTSRNRFHYPCPIRLDATS